MVLSFHKHGINLSLAQKDMRVTGLIQRKVKNIVSDLKLATALTSMEESKSRTPPSFLFIHSTCAINPRKSF
jgi:hypothetical protein